MSQPRKVVCGMSDDEVVLDDLVTKLIGESGAVQLRQRLKSQGMRSRTSCNVCGLRCMTINRHGLRPSCHIRIGQYDPYLFGRAVALTAAPWIMTEPRVEDSLSPIQTLMNALNLMPSPPPNRTHAPLGRQRFRVALPIARRQPNRSNDLDES